MAVLPECINHIWHFTKALCLVLSDRDSSSLKQLLRFNCHVNSIFIHCCYAALTVKLNFLENAAWFGPSVRISLDSHAC